MVAGKTTEHRGMQIRTETCSLGGNVSLYSVGGRPLLTLHLHPHLSEPLWARNFFLFG